MPGEIGEGESVEGSIVSGSYFTVLGVKPVVGRAFTMEDDRTPGAHPVAVISHRYWQRRWAGAPDAVGRTFTLNDGIFTVIGVAPPEFFGVSVGKAPDLWIPTMMKSQVYPGRNGLTERGYTWVQIIARLKPEISLQQAQADLNLVFQRIQSQADGSDGRAAPRVVGSENYDGRLNTIISRTAAQYLETEATGHRFSSEDFFRD